MFMKSSPVEPDDPPVPQAALTARAVFIKWEKLRVVYNVILLTVFWLFVAPSVDRLSVDSMYLAYYLMGGLAANLCFFAGPLLESYLAWLGIRSPWLTAAIFIGGVLISLPLVTLYGAAAPRPFPE
jgi:hypothetical protein